MEIPEGRGGGGLNQKTFHGRGVDIFWNNTFINESNVINESLKQTEEQINITNNTDEPNI